MWRGKPPRFWIGIAIFVLSIVDNVIFFSWRRDKPPSNPGGPLASMGWSVMLWEVSGNLLMALATAVFSVEVAKSEKSKHGAK